MHYIDLKTEEIEANFTELFRFPPFFSQSANGWLQRRVGTCFEFYVLDQMTLREDPAATQLTCAENVRRHWYEDVTETRTKYLFKALEQGLISEEEYRAHATEDVYYRCGQDEPTWRYEFICPHCERTANVFLPRETPAAGWGGRVPECPFCGGYLISIERFGRLSRPAHNEITIKQETTGGGSVYADYVMYPFLDGESAEDRKARLVGIALESCKDAAVPEAEKRELLELLYDKHPNLLHVAKELVEEVAREDFARVKAVVEGVTLKDNANSMLRRLGFNTQWFAPAPDVVPAIAVIQESAGMGFGMGIASMQAQGAAQPAAEVAQSATVGDVPKKFCAFCGAAVSGKFCPECGMPVKE